MFLASALRVSRLQKVPYGNLVFAARNGEWQLGVVARSPIHASEIRAVLYLDVELMPNKWGPMLDCEAITGNVYDLGLRGELRWDGGATSIPSPPTPYNSLPWGHVAVTEKGLGIRCKVIGGSTEFPPYVDIATGELLPEFMTADSAYLIKWQLGTTDASGNFCTLFSYPAHSA